MNELVDKLVADLRWRLTRAGKQFKPTLKERENWGVFRFPPLASILIWLGVFPLIVLIAEEVGGPDEAEVLLGMVGITVLTLLVTAGVHQFNKAMIVRKYRSLLLTNERFTLVEYAKYIKRQIKRAQTDPVLGGPVEVQRLYAVYRKLNDLLHKGAGADVFKVESQLSKEADLAEAVVESYELPVDDDLAALDQKLPPDLRERLAELDREIIAPAARKSELE